MQVGLWVSIVVLRPSYAYLYSKNNEYECEYRFTECEYDILGLYSLPICAERFAMTIRALLIASIASFAAAEETSGTVTMLVTAQSLSGETLPGVKFDVVQKEQILRSFATNKQGFARVPAADFSPGWSVALADKDYSILQQNLRTPKDGGKFLFLKLYENDPSKMSADETVAYVNALPEIYAGDRKAHGLAGAGEEITAARLAAFLEGFRDEVDGDGAAAKAAAPTAPSMTVTVVDGVGRPVARRGVLLYALDGDSGRVRVCASETTGPNGVARFVGLTPETLYRVYAPSRSDGLVAMGSFTMLNEKESRTLPAMALRESRRTVSGIVFEKTMPAAGVRVSIAENAGLQAVTDRFGYYALGPVDARSVTLIFKRAGSAEEMRLPVRADGNEVMAPLELLAGMKK
ncbi:hypothetical protein BH09SUM1_BH09SUM1_33010 [soil metagenome]